MLIWGEADSKTSPKRSLERKLYKEMLHDLGKSTSFKIRRTQRHLPALENFGDFNLSCICLDRNMLVPSCFVIFDLEPLSLSFDFVFMSEIFKSLSFSLDRLCHLAIFCLDNHAHTLHHLETLLTISLDRFDILKEDLVYQSLRKCVSSILVRQYSLITHSSPIIPRTAILTMECPWDRSHRSGSRSRFNTAYLRDWIRRIGVSWSRDHARICRIFLDGYGILVVRIVIFKISSFKLQNAHLKEEHAPTSGETFAPLAPKTTKQLAAKINQARVKSILLLAILDEYLLKFHNVADAKSLWEAIKSRFGGYEESKKMQKNVLKHQFENFSIASNESLDKAYDRFQKLISQLEVPGALYQKEDINQKVFKKIDGADLGNEIFVADGYVERQSKVFIQRTGKNMDLKKINLSRRNQGRRSYGDNGRSNAPTNESSSQALVAQDGLGGYDWSNDFEVEPVNYALMAISSSSSSSSSDSEVQKCSKQCLESFKTLQKNYDTEREKHNKAKLEIRGYEIALESLESRILGHEKNELAWGEKYEFQNYELKCREIKINNLNLELEKVVKERDELKDKIAKWEESTKNLDEILNSQMSARDKTGLGYGTQLNELSSNHETDSENSLSVFDVRSSDEESTPANDMSSKADGYHVVPPPITGNFLTPRADISFAGLDEYAIRNKIIESQTTKLNTKTSETAGKTNDANTEKPKSAKEYEVQTVRPETQTVKTRDDKSGQNYQKQGISFRKVKGCFVCKSTNHLIKDCNFHDKKSQEPKLENVDNTGQREGKPVWDNTKRVNHQNFSKYLHLSKTFIPSGVLTRTGLHRPSVSTARPICIARPNLSTARPVYAARPIYPRMDNVRPRGSCSPIKRSYYTKPAFRPKDIKQDVKTFGVQNMTTVGTRVVVNTGKGNLDTNLKKSRWVWRPKGNYLDHVFKDNGSFMLKKVKAIQRSCYRIMQWWIVVALAI
ncbi:hypothetical protein Tco_0787167 [Tanacetum coccineum]